MITGAAGGMGLTAIQIAKAIGATVIAAASSLEKLAVCKTVGADALVNYSEKGFRESIFPYFFFFSFFYYQTKHTRTHYPEGECFLKEAKGFLALPALLNLADGCEPEARGDNPNVVFYEISLGSALLLAKGFTWEVGEPVFDFLKLAKLVFETKNKKVEGSLLSFEVDVFADIPIEGSPAVAALCAAI